MVFYYVRKSYMILLQISVIWGGDSLDWLQILDTNGVNWRRTSEDAGSDTDSEVTAQNRFGRVFIWPRNRSSKTERNSGDFTLIQALYALPCQAVAPLWPAYQVRRANAFPANANQQLGGTTPHSFHGT